MLLLENKGSLITFKDERGDDCSLGDLFHSPEDGTFDPTHGRVDVTRKEADERNRCLAQAQLDGLTATCQVGQGGMFYAKVDPYKADVPVTTWKGAFVATARRHGKASLEFTKGVRRFVGRIRKDADCVFFKRTR